MKKLVFCAAVLACFVFTVVALPFLAHSTELEFGLFYPLSWIIPLDSSNMPPESYAPLNNRYGIQLDFWTILSGNLQWGLSGSFSEIGVASKFSGIEVLRPMQLITTDFQLGYNTKLLGLSVKPKIGTGVFVDNWLLRVASDSPPDITQCTLTRYGVDLNLGTDLKIYENGPFYSNLSLNNRFIYFLTTHNQYSGGILDGIDNWTSYSKSFYFIWNIGLNIGYKF